MLKNLFTIIFCFLVFAVSTNAQENKTTETIKRQEAKTVQKANQRPSEPAVKPEPFDGVDVKTMAAKCVVFETEKGNIKMEMFPESAPNTVRNFLNLVTTNALDTTTFGRVVPDFVIQGGDLWSSKNLTNDLKWRAVRTIPDEPNLIKHERGILSMARSEEPNSATTSFFILLREAATLDGKFAAFGRVTQGMEIVEEINNLPVENEKPKEPVRINKAKIEPCPAENTASSIKQ
ncbi:MAG: peptidylprolyl isomerase [Acidobacteriota bacterium]|nr:peptidylprolyl isomerase [Acidobacteriota bacterium]